MRVTIVVDDNTVLVEGEAQMPKPQTGVPNAS